MPTEDITIPYLASLEWYFRRLRGEKAAPGRGRYNRSAIASGGGELILTVPVKGGIRTIKRCPAQQWLAADEKPWRHTHLGALAAAYGRTPYYSHYMPAIEAAIADRSMVELNEISLAIHNVALRALDIEGARRMLASCGADRRAMFMRRADEISASCRPGLSMFDAIFRFGPEAIFSLLPALY